eukprot:PhF_6_TR17928/c0_g1_i2/m.26879
MSSPGMPFFSFFPAPSLRFAACAMCFAFRPAVCRCRLSSGDMINASVYSGIFRSVCSFAWVLTQYIVELNHEGTQRENTLRKWAFGPPEESAFELVVES